VFQAVLLLAKHYTMHLTTVVTALMCGSRKRTQFIATDMSLFGALKSSKNGLCSDTISRLCVFQAVPLLAKHYTMHLTTVVTALMCSIRKRTQFIATDMLLFGALKSSKYVEL
jgi:tetrahydromethanopterin S-methyltransferase subunit F